MLNAPVIVAAAIGATVVVGATAIYVFSGPSAISLPKEAYDEDTVMACVFDMERFDEDAVETVETTIRDFIDNIEELSGDEMSERDEQEFDDAMDAMGEIAQVIQDHEIKVFAMTLAVDLDELLQGNDPDDAGLMFTLLVNAGTEPDLVQLATDIGDAIDEEPSKDDLEEIEDNVEFEDLGGGWYAIEIDGREGEFIGLPSGEGDSETAGLFNDALAKTAGGIFQFAMTPPDLTDLMELAPGGDDMFEAYRQMPDEIQDVLKGFDDIEMISYAIDIGEGFGFREYLVYEDTDDAKDMIEAIEAMREELPDMMEELAEEMGMDDDDMEEMQETMLEMMDLYEVSRSGNTIEISMDEDSFSEMMELILEVLAPAMASSRDNARFYEERAYDDHSWEDREYIDDDRDYAEEATEERYDSSRIERRERAYDYAEDEVRDAAE